MQFTLTVYVSVAFGVFWSAWLSGHVCDLGPIGRFNASCVLGLGWPVTLPMITFMQIREEMEWPHR